MPLREQMLIIIIPITCHNCNESGVEIKCILDDSNQFNRHLVIFSNKKLFSVITFTCFIKVTQFYHTKYDKDEQMIRTHTRGARVRVQQGQLTFRYNPSTQINNNQLPKFLDQNEKILSSKL